MRGMHKSTSQSTQQNLKAKAAAALEPGLSTVAGPPTGSAVRPMTPPSKMAPVAQAAQAANMPVAYAKGGKAAMPMMGTRSVLAASPPKGNPIAERQAINPRMAGVSPRGYKKGGKVKHDDAAQDKALFKQMFQQAEAKEAPEPMNGMRTGGKTRRYADGGPVKQNPDALWKKVAKERAITKQNAAAELGMDPPQTTPSDFREADEAVSDARQRNLTNGMKSGGKAKSGKWIKGAVKKPGELHRDLGVPQGQKIPKAKIAAAAKGSGKVAQRARFAQNVAKFADGGPVAPYKNAPSPNPNTSDGMKKGGRACFAMGGSTKIQRGEMSTSGAPTQGTVSTAKVSQGAAPPSKMFRFSGKI